MSAASKRAALLGAASELQGYMNCKLFAQTLLDCPTLDKQPSEAYRGQPLAIGDTLAWGDGRHYAVWVGGGEVVEVEEWGAEPQVAKLADLVQEMDPPDVVYKTAKKRNPASLGYATHIEQGVLFETGTPVVIPVTHRKQKTAQYGSTFGQDIEPHGRYVVLGHLGTPGTTDEGWGHMVTTIHDTVRFRSPLVLHHGGTGSGPGAWKRRVSDAYGGKKGKALSRAINKDGYDAIVTVDTYGRDNQKTISEIVDLTMFPLKPKKNPLLARPVLAPGTRTHRMGEEASRRVQELFGLGDIYHGVHVTSSPFAAMAYALGRRTFAENDFGLLEIEDPGILLGLSSLCGPIEPDADVLTTAQALLHDLELLKDNFAEFKYGEQDDEYGEGPLATFFAENHEAIEELARDNSHSSYGDVAYTGIENVAGDLANRPSADDYMGSLKTLTAAWIEGRQDDGFDEEEASDEALKLALQIVPQARVMCDVPESAIACVLLAPNYMLGTEHRDYEDIAEYPEKFIDISKFEVDELYRPHMDEMLLEDAQVVWGNCADSVWWHGTSLSLASLALPGIFTPALQAEIREKGSLWDEDELASFYEEEDDELEI
jgi:hypothetical protein